MANFIKQTKSVINSLQNIYSTNNRTNQLETNQRPIKKETIRIFLGGTANNSTWRDKLIPLLDKNPNISYFNPVITGREWTLQDQENEFLEKDRADFLLYVITKEALGFYAITEAVDDSNKHPERVVFCYLEEGFDPKQIRSLQATAKIIYNNIEKVNKKAKCFTDLNSLANWFHNQVETAQEENRYESRVEEQSDLRNSVNSLPENSSINQQKQQEKEAIQTLLENSEKINFNLFSLKDESIEQQFNEIKQLQTDNHYLNEIKSNQERKIAELEELNRKNKDQVEKLNQENSLLKSQATKLENSIAKLVEQEKLEEALKKANFEKDKLSEKIIALRIKNKELIDKFADLNDQLLANQKIIHQIQNRIYQLEAENVILQKKIVRSQSNYQKLEQERFNVANQLQNQELTEQEKEQLQLKIKHLELEIDRERKFKRQLVQEIKDKKTKVTNLEQKIIILKDERIEKIKLKNSLSGENNKLEIKIELPNLTKITKKRSFKVSNKTETNEETKLNYQTILPKKNYRDFYWQDNNFQPDQLPPYLYDLKNNQIIERFDFVEDNGYPNYAILSYNWPEEFKQGNPIPEICLEQMKNGTGQSIWQKIQITYLNHLKDQVDYLWVDRICINQSDNERKAHEVRHMGEYYSQAAVTLIVIDDLIGEKNLDENNKLAHKSIQTITKNDWFQRVWCFQEGLLAKQALYMFNDYLVDGRFLAWYWGTEGKTLTHDFLININKITYATPLGWSYGANPEQIFYLNFAQAWAGIAQREQFLLIDRVYALLGLIPHGHLVETEYKTKNCKCSFKSKERCNHQSYSSKDLIIAIETVKEVTLKNQEKIAKEFFCSQEKFAEIIKELTEVQEIQDLQVAQTEQF